MKGIGEGVQQDSAYLRPIHKSEFKVDGRIDRVLAWSHKSASCPSITNPLSFMYHNSLSEAVFLRFLSLGNQRLKRVSLYPYNFQALRLPSHNQPPASTQTRRSYPVTSLIPSVLVIFASCHSWLVRGVKEIYQSKRKHKT